MRSSDPSALRYLELNSEHLDRFLEAMGREFEVDRSRVEELIRGTVNPGAIESQLGLPHMRLAGRWSSTS